MPIHQQEVHQADPGQTSTRPSLAAATRVQAAKEARPASAVQHLKGYLQTRA